MKLPAARKGANDPRPLNAESGQKAQAWRLPLLAAAILALLVSIYAGLIRMGWQWPVLQPALIGAHGPLMISGFFGTLIGVERAVALRLFWPYGGPVLTGVGGILLVAGVKGPIPALLLTAGSLWLVLVFGVILRRHCVRYTLVMAGGALAWAVGNSLWLVGWPVARVVLWWAAFLILTIAGERLELGRLVRHPARVENLFIGVGGFFLAGLLLSIFLPGAGTRLAALGLIGLAAWLLRFDIARKTVRQNGLPRFAAVCLLSGYAWLAIAGAIGLRVGAVSAGFLYDAFIHAIFLGFVFAMIFAHAPIIFPAILNLPIQYERIAYLPLCLLHFSLLVRISGDLLYAPALRAWGGLLNGIAILAFLALTARSVLAGFQQSRARTARTPMPGIKGSRANLALDEVWPRRLWNAALAAFLVAGLTGSLLRFWMVEGFPPGINLLNVRHAHSHLMYFAWVTPALMALIAARLPAQTGKPAPAGMRWAAGAALFLGLLAYPPFFLWGYQPALLAGQRLPLSILLSTLNILAWYAFAFSYRQATRGVRYNRSLKLWNAALIFLLAASLGAWGRAVLAALKIEDAFLSAASVHLFLDLFSNGWAVVGLLGLAYAARPKLSRSIAGWQDPLLFLGLPLSFLLGVPVDLVPIDLRTLAGLGGLLAATGLFMHVKTLWPHFGGEFWGGWRAPLFFLLLKAGLEAAACLAPLARWGEALGLRIIYLHVLLLGFVTLALIAAGLERWYGQVQRRAAPLGWSSLALLASLMPLSGLWPELLAGPWRLWVAFVFSFGPAIAVVYLMAGIRRRAGKLLAKEPIPPPEPFRGRAA